MLTNPCDKCYFKNTAACQFQEGRFCEDGKKYHLQQETAQEIFKEIETHYKEGHSLMHFIFVIEDWQSLKEKWGLK
jgi:hypothetical protein